MIKNAIVGWIGLILIVVLVALNEKACNPSLKASEERLAQRTFTTISGVDIDRLFDKEAGILCYITVSQAPSIYCIKEN